MNSFLKLLLGVLVFNKGPQDFPCSITLMRICLLGYFITGLPSVMTHTGLEKAILAMALDVVLLMLFVYFCLQAFSKSARYIQTITSLAFVGVFFQIVMYPMVAEIGVDVKQGDPTLSLILLVAIWMFSVYVYIFKESFSIRLPAAIGLVICYGFMSQIISSLLFPELIQ